MTQGYYRFPTIYQDTIVFVSEDDLWSTPVSGGIARRLTSNLGEVTRPRFSPDGQMIAFVGREEGQPEIYVMPSQGGSPRRVTYMGGSLCLTAGWTPDGQIVFANNAGHWYLRFTHLYAIDPLGNQPEQLNFGLARAISFGPTGSVVIGRHTDEPARWKRYRGGTAGQIWIDPSGQGEFKQLVNLQGNVASPIWYHPANQNDRIFFISDHEGIGTLYSVTPDGDDLRRHTHHRDFYARNASSDGRRIVYHAGSELYVFDPTSDQASPVRVQFHSPRTQRNRKFIPAGRFLQDWSLHPNGQWVAAASRGKLFSFANWEGAVTQHGSPEELDNPDKLETNIRYRLPTWLSDGERLLAVSDEVGEEQFVIFSRNQGTPVVQLPILDIGRPDLIAVNPRKDQIIFSNHRYELMFLDLNTHDLRLIDRGHSTPIDGCAWSPDGEWAAYSISVSLHTQVLKLWRANSGEIVTLTNPVFRDVAPAFDSQGKYLFFLSYRNFEPVYDNLHFDLGFPTGMKPYLITLQKDLPSPFIPQPKPAAPEKDLAEKPEKELLESVDDFPPDSTHKPSNKPEEIQLVQIDLDGIDQRVFAFPVSEGIYRRIFGIEKGKVLYSRYPVQSALDQDGPDEPMATGSIMVYNLEEQKEDLLINRITDFAISLDRKMISYRSGNNLRVIKAGEKPDNNGNDCNRKTGWIDLERLKVSVLPGAEWRQMIREAWRLQRDQFWTPDMSLVDWVSIHNRYLPLVDRVSSRSEFSDLMWEMQGELGTSHAYEFGGDYRPEPKYHQGFLGADFKFDDEQNAWQVNHIYRGDAWNPKAASPLLQSGVNVSEGDFLLAVNGRKLSQTTPPSMALVNLASQEVILTIQTSASQAKQKGTSPFESIPRQVTVKTLASEFSLRYREWVENNRQYVHQATMGKVGYLHIPDMMGWGYAEFHRGFLAEADFQGLIVDVRFNRGGHVSSLLLEKLARRRIGYDHSRWGQIPIPYPVDSVQGPLVAITNEFAGSDGDIFSHGFKLMKLGPLIGKRTWGGVIGIDPRQSLVDGTVTTQPEFSFWFNDVGWGVENYGTDPDIDVEITPQDYRARVDTQLERAIQVILDLLIQNPPLAPNFSNRPNLALPRLP